MANKVWRIKFNEPGDDLGTSLMPDEIHVDDNHVESISGNWHALEVRLRQAREKLSPDDITIKRHRADFSDSPMLMVVDTEPIT